MHLRNQTIGKRGLMLGAVATALLACFAASSPVSAHPLGNFTVNQYSRIEVRSDGLRLVYVLDLAEVPAFQELRLIDADGDGRVSRAEQDAYRPAKLAEITPHLRLVRDGTALPLAVVASEITFPEGQAGLKLIRLRAVLAPESDDSPPSGAADLTYENGYLADRIGWKEIVVTHGPGVALHGANVPQTDASDELRAYPEDMLQSVPDQTAAVFRIALAPGAPAASGFDRFAAAGTAPGTAATSDAARPDGGGTGGRFAALLDDRDLSRIEIIIALVAAMAWGATHALSPGHGKTVVGAYLIGSRATPRHAAFLGATVTMTHTAGVIALGLVTLFASRYVVPEILFPWLSVVSGLLVVAMGLWTLRHRLRGGPRFGHRHGEHGSVDHTHGDGRVVFVHSHGGSTHSHLPPSGTPVGWRGLFALGVSGGLIPCPSALVVLLGSVALGRVGFGLALVIAFSLGLAATLTGLGLLFLAAGRLFERHVQPEGRWRLALRYGPALGSIALTIAGAAILLRALGETGLY